MQVCAAFIILQIYIIEIIFEEVNLRREDGNGMDITLQPMFL